MNKSTNSTQKNSCGMDEPSSDAIDISQVVEYLIILLALGEVPLQNSQEQVECEERPPQDEDDEKNVSEDRQTAILDLIWCKRIVPVHNRRK